MAAAPKNDRMALSISVPSHYQRNKSAPNEAMISRIWPFRSSSQFVGMVFVKGSAALMVLA